MSETGAIERSEELEFLRGFVEEYSPSEQEEPAREYLLEKAPDLGFDVDVDSVGNVIASNGGSGDEILLTSHMDTVRGEIPVKLEGGELYGRGSVDAKGPLSAMFMAAARCLEVGANVRVAAVVEEEKSGMGARNLRDGIEQPDYLINGEPSGWDTVTLGYRGILRMRYRVTGEVIHTAQPGVNAIEDVIEFWNRVSEIDEEQSGFNHLHATPTKIDSNSDGFELRSELRGNVRIPPSNSVKEIRSRVKECSEGLDGSVYWGESTEPVLVDRSNSLVSAFNRGIQSENGETRFSAKTGTSDMNVFAEEWSCPMVTYGPGDSTMDHTPDERLSIDEYHRSIDVLTRVIRELSDR